MDKSTKFLSLTSLLIIILGIFFLWSGLKPAEKLPTTPMPTSVSSREFEATGSALGESTSDQSLILVTKVIDGDTIAIQGGEKVRLIGIDTPETVDPRRPVGCFGKEASNETKRLLTGKKVYLEKDVSETDKYKRLLRYIYLPLDGSQMLFVNDYLVREGFATALTYPPDVKYSEQFLEAQRQAREAKKGLWGRC